MSNTIAISSALEDYLETILNLYEQNDVVRITDIAEKLNIAKASATQAIKALINLNLLKHEKYGPIELTQLGKEHAMRIRQRHRILKKFLTEILNIKPEIAEKDACLMEHVVSSTTMEGLIKFLEERIDLKDDKKEDSFMEKKRVLTLDKLSIGMKAKIIKIAAKGKLRQHIMDMGLTSGTEFKVEGVAPLGDPIEISVRGYHLSLRKNEVEDIFVEVI